jgi:hypothetical protein
MQRLRSITPPLFLRLVVTLAWSFVTDSHAQHDLSNIANSVRQIATLKATAEVCLSSAEFRKISDDVQRKVVDFSSRIDYLANDLHASEQSRLLYFTYSTTLLQYNRIKSFPASLSGKFGGICSDAMVKGIEADLKISESVVRRYLKSVPK